MSYRRKEHPPSRYTHKTRRVLKSLPIKDLPQAILDCLPSLVESNSYRCHQPVSDPYGCCPGTSCTSHDQQEERGSCPSAKNRGGGALAFSCTPKCTEFKAAALLEELQQCREMIKALHREANAVTDVQDDCECSNAGKKKRCRANCKKKKTAAKNCCQKRNRKKAGIKNLTFDDCVCPKSETKEQNVTNSAGYQYPCQGLFEKNSTDKITSSSESSVVDNCECQKEMIKQYKAYHKKVNHGDSCNCFKKKLEKKSSYEDTSRVEQKVADKCVCAKEMEKRNKAKKVDSKGTVVSEKSCQICEKKTSDKLVSCCLPPSDDNHCKCDEKRSQRNKVQLERETSADSIPCCQKLFRRTTIENETCCCFPLDETNDCDCDKGMKNQGRANFKMGFNSDSPTCYQELSRKQTSDKEIYCCLPSGDDVTQYDDETKKINKVNFKNRNSDKEDSNRKKTSNKVTCCCFPSMGKVICECNEYLKKKSEKPVTSLAAKASDTSALATCECRMPPAFTQQSVDSKQENVKCVCRKK